jgi:hypothetical protein
MRSKIIFPLFKQALRDFLHDTGVFPWALYNLVRAILTLEYQITHPWQQCSTGFESESWMRIHTK